MAEEQKPEPTERERWIAVEVLSGKRLVHDHGTYLLWESPWNFPKMAGQYQYATNSDGDFIGFETDALELQQQGIAPERRRGSAPGSTCSVGFCAHRQSWYGWSHRARREFRVGDEAFLVQWTEDADGQGYAPIPPGHGVMIQTLEDARQSAELFAEDVS